MHMTKQLKQCLLGGATVVLGALWSADALASYPCQVTYHPNSSIWGSYGYILLSWYSGPNCSGTQEGGSYICSSGATYAYCASSSYHYPNTVILTLWENLQRAAADNQKIQINKGTCINSAYSSCITTVTFRSD